MFRSKWMPALGLLSLLAFGAGCGGDDETASSPTVNTPSAPTVDTTATDETSDDDRAPDGNTEPPLSDVSAAVESVPTPETSNGENSDSADADPNEVTVRTATPDDFKKLIASHKGKVVFVDFWATWCVPCRKAFPKTVKLAKQHADDGLAVVSMSLDDADAKEDALAFLKEQNAVFDNLMCSFGGETESYEAYEIPGDALPYFRIYDREGNLKHTFGYNPETDEGVDEVEVHKALEALLAENK